MSGGVPAGRRAGQAPARPLAAIADLVRREAGVLVPPAREASLRRALHRAAPDLSPEGFVRAAAEPAAGRELVGRLIDEVTVQETAFLRDRSQFDAIDWDRLLRGAGRVPAGMARAAASPLLVRVWSAGCATGEEAYTLALLAAEAFAPALPPVDVLGTDISGTALAAAEAGRYRGRSVAAVSGPLRHRYLEPGPGGTFLAGDLLRSRVRFRRHNLASDPLPPPCEPPFDLVVCRNVLIYFDTPLVGRVTRLLERAVRPGGELILGAADALHVSAARKAGLLEPVPAARPAPGGPGRAAPAGQTAAGRRPAPPPRRPPRPAPGRLSAATRQQRLAAALEVAGSGDSDGALAQVAGLVADDPLDADAHFVHGLISLEAGEPRQAAGALRRALYNDHTLGLAAFALGRAYDELADPAAAQRSYQQALRTLDPADSRHEMMLRQVDIADIVAACQARLGGHPGGQP